jgi:hypothetical protein
MPKPTLRADVPGAAANFPRGQSSWPTAGFLAGGRLDETSDR